MPASSMITNVDGPTAAAQSGSSPCRSDQVSLARVSVRMPVCSPRTAAAAADGARPSTWPPSWVQARVRARMAVVFPAPAGAIASCSRAPEVHICRTSEACPASRAVPFAASLQQSQIHRRLIDHCPVAASGGGDEALLGVEDPLRGVEVGPGDGVDRGPVDPPQRFRFVDAVTPVRPARQTGDPAPHRPTDPPAHLPARRAHPPCGPAVGPRRGHATSARSSGIPP